MEAYLIQGSEAWKEARKMRITGTDASCILGINPYKSAYALWRQKMDLDPPEVENEAMRRGTMLEPLAREWCNNYFMKTFEPKVIIKDFMMASLDGISNDGREIIEIKCGHKAFSSAYNGEIPNYYVCQMQHQMHVADVDLAYYVAFNGETGIIIEVKRDQNFINEMIEKEREFYQCLISFTPPMMTTRDYLTRSDNEWNGLAENYRIAYQALKDAEQLEQNLKRELIALAGQQSTMGNGIKLSKVVKRGSIDYSAIPDIQELDLEPYRKKTIEYFRVTID